MRPLFLFYGRSAVQTGCNTKKKGCRLDRMVKKLWIEIWTYGMLYRSTWGIM